MNPILEEIKFVVDNSKGVKINTLEIEKITKNFFKRSWGDILSVPLGKKQKIAFNFILASLNFSYWGDPKWEIEYENKRLGGSKGMATSIVRTGEKIFDPQFLKNLSEEEVKHIFRGNTVIPLLKERLEILRELGRVVCEEFGGDFENVINQDAGKMLEILTTKFSFFNDSTFYNNKKIHFHKKAQLLIGDLYEMGLIDNVDDLTAFADYKIPLVLRKLGILVYSEELATLVDNKIEIIFGDPKEVEIRANMIWAVELIRKELGVTAMDVDHYLWLLSQGNTDPYHLTRTIYY